MKGNEIRHLDVFYASGKFFADRCFTGLDICSYVKSHFSYINWQKGAIYLKMISHDVLNNIIVNIYMIGKHHDKLYIRGSL